MLGSYYRRSICFLNLNPYISLTKRPNLIFILIKCLYIIQMHRLYFYYHPLLFLSLASLGWFAMEKFHMTQCAKIVLIVLLLLITPLLSSPVRTPYLYFLFNLLLLVLGVESGILTAISRPPEDHRKTSNVSDTTANKLVRKVAPLGAEEESMMVVEKTIVVEKIKPKRCPSTPSLFFIGGFDGEFGADQNGVDEGDQEEEVLSGQELFAKAETFIGNFYKQLKIQREESWRRIHGFYHKAF